jgi:uncharacterized protein
VRAANWILARRALPGGAFSHDEKDAAGPYLGDTLFMGNAFLALYGVTADSSWLDHARAAADFLNEHFQSDSGFFTTIQSGALLSTRQMDENVALARFASLLSHYTGDAAHRKMAEHAMRYLAAQGIAERRGFQVGGILLADRELSTDPLHVTVVGGKADPAARDLFLAALKQPATYKRVEWFDEAEGPLPNADVEYPRIGKAAAFLCTEKACSAPIFTPDKFRVR